MSRNNHFNSNNRIWMPLLIDCVHFLETFVESFASGSTKSICRTFWLLAVHINKCLIIKFQLNDKNKTKMFWRQIEFSEIVFRFCFCTGLSHIPSLEYVHISPFCILNNCGHRGAMTKTSNRVFHSVPQISSLPLEIWKQIFGACVWVPESCRLIFLIFSAIRGFHSCSTI